MPRILKIAADMELMEFGYLPVTVSVTGSGDSVKVMVTLIVSASWVMVEV